VEEPVFKKVAPQLFLSITNSNTVTHINQKHIQELKEEQPPRIYKNLCRK